MSATPTRLSYTELEIRSYLPSGWGIQPDSAPRWNAARGVWAIDVYDGADNIWAVEVKADETSRGDRLAALKASFDRLQRKALGRKSVLTG